MFLIRAISVVSQCLLSQFQNKRNHLVLSRADYHNSLRAFRLMEFPVFNTITLMIYILVRERVNLSGGGDLSA
jgi:hypothetical protein